MAVNTAPTITVNAAADRVILNGQLSWTNLQDGLFLARTTTVYRIELPYRGTPFDPAFVSPLPPWGGEVALAGTASVVLGDPKTIAASDGATDLRIAIFDLPPEGGTTRQLGLSLEAFDRSYAPGALNGDQRFQFALAFEQGFDAFTGVTVGLRVRTPSFGTGGISDPFTGSGLDTVEFYRGENDFASLPVDPQAGVTRNGSPGDNALGGTDRNDRLFGEGGNDILVGGLGDDLLHGGSGNDTADYRAATTALAVTLVTAAPQATGPAGIDTLVGIENLVGGTASDTLSGNGFANRIEGGAGSDTILGQFGNDTLFGNPGQDDLQGGAGDDVLLGGPDRDWLTGGSGSDTFLFRFAAHSAPGQADVIRDFEAPGLLAGDVIDLSAIDANPGTPANDPFVFGVTGLRGLFLGEQGADTFVYANLDQDPAAELSIRIVDLARRSSAYTAADFLL